MEEQEITKEKLKNKIGISSATMAALTKDWKEAGDGVKITEKKSGKLVRKYGGLYTEKDLEKAKSEIEEFNKLNAEEQKEFLLFLGTPNIKVNEENIAKGYYVMFDQLHYLTKLDSKNSDSTYFDKFLHLPFDSMLNFIKDGCFHTIHSNVRFAVDF